MNNQPVKGVLSLTGFFIFTLLLSACADTVTEHPSFKIKGHTMGTTYMLKVVDDVDVQTQKLLKEEIDRKLLALSGIFSTYDPQSELSKLNQLEEKNVFQASEEFLSLLGVAQGIHDRTNGAYDLTIGPLVNLWGFGPDFSDEKIPSNAEIKARLEYVGMHLLKVDATNASITKAHSDVYVDFSSIAKGYAVDVIATLLEGKGFNAYMVEIGGEMRVKGLNAIGLPWRIAVENPVAEQRSIYKVLNLKDQSVATSGDYRNFFEMGGQRYSHTINPKSGYPEQHDLASVTVIAQNCALADAWATALMVLGEKKGYDLAEQENISALFLVMTEQGVKELPTTHYTKLALEKKQ